jgi:hypothetical protein
MQHHSIATYLRFLGIALGIVFFVFMLFRSEQNVHDPTFVRGKRSQQSVAVSPQNVAQLAVATDSASTTAEIVIPPEPTEAEQGTDTASAPIAADDSDAPQADGKPGQAKKADMQPSVGAVTVAIHKHQK